MLNFLELGPEPEDASLALQSDHDFIAIHIASTNATTVSIEADASTALDQSTD
jgi:hypothetical protein